MCKAKGGGKKSNAIYLAFEYIVVLLFCFPITKKKYNVAHKHLKSLEKKK